MTEFNSDLLEEVTGSIAGCLGTLELALAATADPLAVRALETVAQVLLTSHEHLSRVDAMVFNEPEPAAPAGPQVMGQEEDAECLHLDLLGPLPGGVLVCRDCAETITGVPGE